MTKSSRFLHVGCGPAGSAPLPEPFHRGSWTEVRLDLDPAHGPDIACSITDMAPVADASFQAVYSAHNLEHLAEHEVHAALSEIRRVLAPGGFALVTVPDIQAVAQQAALGDLHRVLYVSPAGPVRIIDVLYGFTPAIAEGNTHMRHRTGFSAACLTTALARAGFAATFVLRRTERFALTALACADHCAAPHDIPWWLA
ncbi:class I SAM-dependent methyltransferase [Fundidesulfovibrio soli]|uniref:class I SAM-dependent methyltransferase n=1 Tax=Fundidesulfovibrio soli TaxID=2922716 RepID=UPI001FAFCA64|nr:methyltransferase domain-containing protein [Fundidesulfovibrio soli]